MRGSAGDVPRDRRTMGVHISEQDIFGVPLCALVAL